MQIRQAEVADARAIAEIHVLAWQAAYRGIMADAVLDGLSIETRAQLWTARLSQTESNTLVAVEGERVIGWAVFGPCRDADAAGEAELYGIYLDPAVYRQGIGRRLWSGVCGVLAGAGQTRFAVWVLAANAPARRFYEAMGGRPDGAEKMFVQDGAVLPEVRYWCGTAAGDSPRVV